MAQRTGRRAVSLEDVAFPPMDGVVMDWLGGSRERALDKGDGYICGTISSYWWYGNGDGNGGSRECQYNRSGIGCYSSSGWKNEFEFK